MASLDLSDVYAPLAALLRASAGSLTATLEGDGVGVFDGALGNVRCNALRSEIDSLHEAGDERAVLPLLFTPHCLILSLFLSISPSLSLVCSPSYLCAYRPPFISLLLLRQGS